MIEGIFHVGITVSNLDRSIEFYRDVLDMELYIGPSAVMSGEEFSRRVGAPDSRIRIAVMRAGKGDIELMEFLSPARHSNIPVDRTQIGAAHVALHVSDIDATVQRLKSNGVNFLGDVTTEAEGATRGWQWVFFRDPDGILLELSSAGSVVPAGKNPNG